jgi:hypothetical protein
MKSKGCGVMSTTRSAPLVAERGEPLLGDGVGDHGLAGEVGQAEAHRARQRPDDDIGELGRLVGELAAHPRSRPVGGLLHDVGGEVPGDHPGGRGPRRDRVEADGERGADALVRVLDVDIGRELAQHREGALAGGVADDDDAGVGEVAGELGLHPPHRPLLEDVGEHRAVADGDASGGVAHRFQLAGVAAEEAARLGLAGPGHGDGVTGEGPLPDELLGALDVAAGADPDDAEVVPAEGDLLVVVPLLALEGDVDDGEAPTGAALAAPRGRGLTWAHRAAPVATRSSTCRRTWAARLSGSGIMRRSQANPMLSESL